MCTTDELELMFNRLVSQPLKGKGLPNDNSRNLNSSNPIIHHLDDSPLPVAKGSCEPSAGNSNSNLLQNPEDNDPKIEESESEQANDLEIDAGVRFLAIRFFNILLAKCWRRRTAEVNDLHTLVRKYQAHVSSSHQMYIYVCTYTDITHVSWLSFAGRSHPNRAANAQPNDLHATATWAAAEQSAVAGHRSPPRGHAKLHRAGHRTEAAEGAGSGAEQQASLQVAGV